jgi:hypothetical protein
MPRKPNILRPTPLKLMLPEDIRAKLDLILYSEVEGRVPLGAYQRFFLERLQEYFSREAPLKSVRAFLEIIDNSGIVTGLNGPIRLAPKATSLVEGIKILQWLHAGIGGELGAETRARLEVLLKETKSVTESRTVE